MRFDWTLNFGHLLILFGLIVSGISVYSTINATLVKQELRINQVEQGLKDHSANSITILNSLWKMQSDMAVVRDRLDRDTKTK